MSGGAYPRSLYRGLLLVYEDRDLLVVDKPAGLLSIAAGGEREKTVYWILAEYLRHKGEKRRPAAVHRLDRDTSGLLLFVKSPQMKKQFMENWNKLIVLRQYVALAEGSPASDGQAAGVIDAPLGEDASGRVIVQKEGKPALTRWKLLAAGSAGKNGKAYSLLSLELETGRRNQIRAHLAWLGCPVAGDRKYFAKTDPLGRLCLHACRLVFRHPKDGKIMEFESPLPKGFEGQTGTVTPAGALRDSRNSYRGNA